MLSLIFILIVSTLTILLGVIVGVTISERRLLNNTYYRQVCILTICYTVFFILKHMDKLLGINREQLTALLNHPASRIVWSVVSTFLAVYVFFYSCITMRASYIDFKRRVLNVKKV